jgi:peptide/nickel transport system permease protein
MTPAFAHTPLRRFADDFMASRVALCAAVLLAALVLAALFAPVLAPQDPYDLAQLDIMASKLEPGTRGAAGQVFLLGTDEQGRDLLSAILYGLRTSLGVGLLSTAIALALGTWVGLISAWLGGTADAVLMRIVDLQLSFPAILVALVLLAVLGQGVDKVVLALIIVQWAYYARAVRGNALVERNREYIEAARCLALSPARIVLRHLLPNCLPPLIVIGTVQIAHAIALEATLSFLGLGMPITSPSLGLLIANGFTQLLSGKYWISFFPGFALLLTIVAINLVGDHLRDVLNPRLSR